MAEGRWRERRAARRVRAGSGEPLRRFRWWQLFTRSLLSITLPVSDGPDRTYAVDVRQAGDLRDGEVRARLYLEGALVSYSKLPARFSVTGGHIEVAVGTFGLRRCHYVPTDGDARQLTPHPASAEGRRAGLHRRHPALSRLVGVISTLLVLVGVAVAVLQLTETISQVPPIAEALGTFESPLHLSVAATVALGVATVVGSTERALRLRSSWLDALAS